MESDYFRGKSIGISISAIRELFPQIITGSTRSKRVIILTKAREGKVHDKRQLEEEDLVPHIPDQVAIEGDLGFN